MQRFIRTVFLVVSSCAVLAAQAQVDHSRGFDPDRLKVLHQTTSRFVEEGQHAGLVTLLLHNGRIVDFQTYGYRDLEKKLRMERDTICRIYSMSKIITSVGVLILMEDGRFNLDDAAANYLPELKNLKVMTNGSVDSPELESVKRPITIKHLLTHTSGLVYDFDGTNALQRLYQRTELWNSANLTQFIEKVGKLHLKHQPGDAYTYGINTDVLGALIERVSGATFGDFLAQRIFRPLAMRDTAFDVPPDKMKRLAKTYKHGPAGKLVEAESMLGVWAESGKGVQSGGAGLFSTAIDYSRFAQMLLNGGTLDGQRVLGRKTIELMTTNHLVSLPDQAHGFNRAQGFGLGVEVQLDLGRGGLLGSPGAYGWYGAATTYARIDPVEKVVAIAFAQHFPFNEHNFFAKFANGYYQAVR